MRKLFVLGLLFLLCVAAEAAVKDYVVILQKEPVAKVMKSGLHSKAVSVQRKIVLDEQAKVRTYIEKKLDGKVKDSVAIVLNALLVSIDESDVQKLLSQPDVVRIEENKVRYHLALDMADRVSHMNMLRHQLGLTPQDMGKGLKIAILDTGIDITNPMFDDTGYTYPEGFDPGTTNDSSLTNNKVIVAKNFGDDTDASDQFGHGTACASAAAGREVDMTWGNFSFTLKGSAPGAYLGNYKVFNHNDPQTGEPGATNYAIVAGINAAVGDGMDVINLSLGGTATQSADNDSQVTAVENAVQAGTMVCIAAGNEGYTVSKNPDGSYNWDTFELAEGSVGSPGIAPSAVTVGAVENARTLMLAGTITSSNGTVPDSLDNFRYGTDTRVAKNLSHFGPYPVVSIEDLGVDPEGCSDFGSVDLTGKIALIKRGSCAFCQKIYNAEQAGAIGVIVYNYLADGTTSQDGTQQGGILNMDMSGLTCAPYQTTIPGFFIRLEEGQQIIQMLQNGYDVEASFGTAYPAQSDGYKSIFSSYGPTNIDYNLKPDVSTIGNQLTLATQSINHDSNTMYDESGFAVLEAGTSFSTPLTAGYSAVVKQLFPGLTPADWKSILCITADFTQNYFQTEKGIDYLSYHRGLASTVFTGSGRINMERAANAKVTIIPNAISFGSVDVSSSKDATTVSTDVTVKNISGVDIKLEPSMIKLVDNSKVSASLASTAEISLAAGATATVTLNVTYQGPVATDLQGYLQFYDNYGNTYTVPYFGRFVDSAALAGVASSSDNDNDGLQKSDELYVHSDPFVADTDGDGTNDGAELNATPSTDPANATDSPTIPSYTNKVYIPLTVTNYDRDEEDFTSIYVVNPNLSSAKVVVLFYDKKGELVQTPIERTLGANGWRVFMADNNLDPSDQGWAVVMSNKEVKAMAGVDIYNADGSEQSAAAIPGTGTLSNMLYVPHIAEQTNQWNTMISVANPGTGSVSAQFVPQGGTAIDIPDFSGVDTSNFLDVVQDLYNGTYPFSSSDSSHWWGKIVSNAGIVGMEVFVQENDNLNQAAALLLNETTSNEIVIPHVETSWLWWTGIALNNPNASTINVTFTPYDDNGNELTATSFTMDAGEKLAKLVQSFWADGEYPDGVKWIKVTADAPITGYELFGIDSSGDASSKDALAGVEARPLDAGSSELVYAYTPKLTSNVWSGIVLLNAGDSLANVTINGYNAVGEQVAHTTKLLAKGKRVVSVVGGTGTNDIFSSVTDDIRWIKVTSDQPIHGFELFGDQNFMYLSGVNALY
ncbi:MAG: S8 family serine peptidase [Acidobacteria bacterium]|nr:S8 family serine peptidase [Acidobacteriota bacterium]